MVVTVNLNLPVKTVPDLIAYGKANPGKLSYAVDATSGFGVATGRLLNKRGQIGMVEIPYRSSPQDGSGHHGWNHTANGRLHATGRRQ